MKGHLATECKKVSHKYLSDLDVDNEVDTDQSILNVSNLNKRVAESFDEFDNSLLNFGNFSDNVDKNGNIEPVFVNMFVENVPMSFEADSCFAHAAISEKLCQKHFSNKKLEKNDLSLKDYVGVTFKSL